MKRLKGPYVKMISVDDQGDRLIQITRDSHCTDLMRRIVAFLRGMGYLDTTISEALDNCREILRGEDN